MLPLLLLPLLCGGSLQQQQPGHGIQMQESVSVPEGGCTNVPCSFPSAWTSLYPSVNIYIYWYRSWPNTRNREAVATNAQNTPVKTDTKLRFFLMDPSTNCSLNIRGVRKSDAGTYNLKMFNENNYSYDYQEKKLTLQVTDGTQKPDIHFRAPLESGRPTQLTCSLPGFCEGGTPPSFSWVGDALDSLNPKTSVLTFIPKPWHHNTNLTCLVTLARPRLVTTQKTIQLNVSYAPQNLTISASYGNFKALKILQTTSLPILEGEALQLLCVADSNPSAQLSWFQGSPALNADRISSTGILELPRVGTGEEGEFICQAWHPLGSRRISLNLSVIFPPQLLGPSCSWEDQSVNCSCFSRAQPAPLLRWRLGEALLEEYPNNASYKVTSYSVGPWFNSSLRLPLGLSAALTLSCEAKNVHGAQSASVLLLPGYPPGKQQGSWPLVHTLIRGTLMGACFLLTYGLTWLYYTRCGGSQRMRPMS